MEKTFHFIVVSYYAVLILSSFNEEEYGSCLLEMLLTLDRIACTTESISFKRMKGEIILFYQQIMYHIEKQLIGVQNVYIFHQGNSDEIQKLLQLNEFARSSSSIHNCDHHRDNNEISFNFTNDVSTTRFGLQARGVTII